ncbi:MULTISPECIES: DUF4333 domain-containing protein [unclassified Nocardiopsis]|uniref:DUF4333 domain-containing protein n=1 Tax=unclassified Nocardiopsis TaxID=2649073 RepID=UPI0033F92837
MLNVGRGSVVAGTALGALVLVSGCSLLGGSVSADEAARVSSEMLAEQVGQEPDDFTCEDDLPAEEGAEIRCELSAGGETLGVTLTVTSVDGGNVEWEIQVDE